MVKIALEIFLYIGIVVVYFFALIVATMILVKMGKEDADDFDYAMFANVIQFFVMVAVIAEKVVQWMT